ncbi:AAA family ATPase (plasmid) [Streptomyces laculatispora]|uniref:AAA family ATPase n=1 Tax=Streptomyces laculatispora TaxID=887464 RepID=A0ABY9IF90_9ACTN|nr:AAA family ATPase [Streptomyces laculatispora]WLQ45606.1 AAA family ATPase [Streptomyces laculatispora]
MKGWGVLVMPAGQVRRLVVIAVSDYGDGNADFAKGIADQVAVVTGWLADPGLGPERQFTLKEPEEKLHSVQQVRKFLADEDLVRAQRGETLVVYITGHGQRGPSSGRHYLRFARTDTNRLPGTALTTSEVISAAMGSRAGHVLVMVDSCFAGALANEVPEVLRDLGTRRRSGSLAVVAGCDYDAESPVGSFTELLRRALHSLDKEEPGFAGPYLSFSEWQQVLDTVARKDRGLIKAEWVWPSQASHEPSPCLPNPRYQAPRELGTAVRELPDAAGLFADHWRDRASGRAGEQDAGWYFSGRNDVMRKLTSFVREGSGVMVVTGAAGSGKSALLARLVTLTDPVFLAQPDLARVAESVAEEERPPVGSVDAAVLARNKTSLALIEDLLCALGADVSDSGTAPLQKLQELLSARALAGRVPTVVIDGLDEARHTLTCLNDVVLPLARMQSDEHAPLLRMVLGVRSSPPASADGSAHLRDEDADELLKLLYQALAHDDRQQVPIEVQRTDEATAHNDITAYVEALLSGSEAGPYADAAEYVRAAAEEVARAVAPSFLDARLAAEQLGKAEQVQDLSAPMWQDRLSQGTVALLQEDVREVARHHDMPVELLVRVMRATAFGAGSGLPWAEVWPAVAHALHAPATGPMPVQTYNAAIHTVQTTRLTGYLARGEEDGRLMYRPVHQQVAKVLMQEPAWLVGSSSAAHGQEEEPSADKEQADITRALAGLVPADPASLAHPYIRRHLVTHAAAGNVLDDAHVPMQLLAQETSHSLRAQLGLPLPDGSTHASQLTLTAAALIEPYLDQGVDVASRRSSIALHLAELSGDDRLESDVPPVLAPQGGWWQSATNVLASVGQHVPALTAIEISPNRAFMAVGTKDGVGIWDASSGQHLLNLPAGSVQSMCEIRGSGGRPFLATAGGRGVAIWDPLSGLRVSSAQMPGASRVQVIADGHQRWRLLVRGRSSFIWNPDGNRIAPPSFESSGDAPSSALGYAIVRGPEGRILLASHAAGHLLLRDLESGSITMGVRVPGRVRKLLGVRREGATDLVLAVTPDRVVVWDPDTGRCRQLGDGPGAHPVQILGSRGRVALALERKGSVQVWELQQSAWHPIDTVRVGKITAMAALPPGGQSPWRVATASEAGVRVWDSSSRPMPRGDGLNFGPVNALTTLPISLDGTSTQKVWAIGTATGVDIIQAGRRRPFSRLPSRPAQALYATPEGNLAVATGYGVAVWDVVRDTLLQGGAQRPEEQDTFNGPATSAPSCFLDWPSTSASVATAHPHGVQLTSIADGESSFVPVQLSAVPRAVVGVPAPDGTSLWIAFGSSGGVTLWNLASQQVVTELRIPRQRTDVKALAVLQSGGMTLLAAATRGHIQTWDTATWKPHVSIAAPWTKSLAAVPLSATHHLLASGSGHALTLWDPLTAENLHTLVTADPVEAITTLRDADGSLLLGIGGPAGFTTLKVNIPAPERP